MTRTLLVAPTGHGVGLTATWLSVALALARLLAQSWAIHGPDRAMSPTLIGPLIGTST